MIPEYVERAMRDVGVTEIPGPEQKARIVKMHSHTTLKATDDETPWCASAMCCWLEESGLDSPKSARAADFLNYGTKVDKPFLGCILVLSRGPGLYHVCIYLGETADCYWCLGGNQGDAVSYVKFKKDQLVSVRCP